VEQGSEVDGPDVRALPSNGLQLNELAMPTLRLTNGGKIGRTDAALHTR
jgi:hypothetical protein